MRPAGKGPLRGPLPPCPEVPPAEASLSATARRYGVPVEDAHHALNDALMTAELFLVLATKLSVLGRPRIRDLVRTSRGRR